MVFWSMCGTRLRVLLIRAKRVWRQRWKWTWSPRQLHRMARPTKLRASPSSTTSSKRSTTYSQRCATTSILHAQWRALSSSDKLFLRICYWGELNGISSCVLALPHRFSSLALSSLTPSERTRVLCVFVCVGSPYVYFMRRDNFKRFWRISTCHVSLIVSCVKNSTKGWGWYFFLWRKLFVWGNRVKFSTGEGSGRVFIVMKFQVFRRST